MISVRSVHMRFDGREVLTDISLEVAEGEVVAIMGSSGGGKTTLLRCISGLLRPTGGEVSVDGVGVAKHPEEARKRMGMVFQSAALFDYMDVRSNVLFGIRRQLRLTAEKREDVMAHALEQVGLTGSETLMPDELSGGMRKRVGIARALALNPKVMLYDEPTTGLDPITAYTIDHLLLDIRSRFGVTSLVVTHDVSSVFRTADRVAFLHGGRLIFVGTTDEFAKSQDENIRELVSKSQARSF